ncbi:hypothetical protein E2C01_052979 [Portunus trituberculatus]|uniref:Uncharacterized protein n=1 Tax=Portunus trituberculatus TaxID=210409 RepID=A0A5B7GQS9_PORTR|nr:hypothetical protein [Portunus trituberculatus]
MYSYCLYISLYFNLKSLPRGLGGKVHPPPLLYLIINSTINVSINQKLNNAQRKYAVVETELYVEPYLSVGLFRQGRPRGPVVHVEEKKSNQEIATNTGIALRTFQRWTKIYREGGRDASPPPHKPKGRKRSVSQRTLNIIRRQFEANPRIHSMELKARNPALLAKMAWRTVAWVRVSQAEVRPSGSDWLAGFPCITLTWGPHESQTRDRGCADERSCISGP